MDTRFENRTSLSMTALLPFIILIEGFVSISIEIITIRQLLPVAGGSVIVTSLIIGIFLLFLALGYKKGGQLQTNLQKSLSYNFLLAALWLGIGLSYVFTISFFTVVQKISGPHIIYPLLAYLLFIIAPLIYILGQTIPITMNMTKQTKSVGMVGGDTMSLSTIGSFLGATITSLIFMQFFGVAWTIFINYLLLFSLFLFLFVRKQSLLFWVGLAIASTTTGKFRPKYGVGVSYDVPSTALTTSLEYSRIQGRGDVKTSLRAIPAADMTTFNVSYNFG